MSEIKQHNDPLNKIGKCYRLGCNCESATPITKQKLADAVGKLGLPKKSSLEYLGPTEKSVIELLSKEMGL